MPPGLAAFSDYLRKNMLKKILLASLLALGLNAAPLAVDSVVDNLKIKDQNDREKSMKLLKN